MKRIPLLLLALVLFAAACKEKTTGTAGKEPVAANLDPQAAHDLKLYKYAMSIADPVTAVAALNSYLMRDTAANIAYKDTLLQLYIEMQSVGAAYKLSDEILKVRPNDTAVLEVHIESAKSIGQMGIVLDKVKRLTEIDPNNVEYKFYYARALFESGFLKEAEKELLAIANDPNNATRTTNFVWYNDRGQPVPIEAKISVSAYMTLGQFYAQARDKKTAEMYFRQARALDPKFQPAAQAILGLNDLPF